MKKKFISLSFISLLALVSIVSCKKENVDKSTKTSNLKTLSSDNITTDGNLLIFKNSSVYEEFISNPESEETISQLASIQDMEFTSYTEKLNSSTNTENEIDEPFLEQILNEDKAIQIGDYIYKLNLGIEKAFVLPVAFKDEYNDLVSENTNNKHISRYTSNESVIELVENGVAGEKGLCFQSYAPSRNEVVNGSINLGFAQEMVFDCRIKYTAAAVFFNLKSTASAFVQGLSWSNLNSDFPEYYSSSAGIVMKIVGSRRYKVRCQSEVGFYNWQTEGSANNLLTLQSYQGSKGLNKFQLMSNFFIKYKGNWINLVNLPSTIQNSSVNPIGYNYYPFHQGIMYGY
jgi:hypothetical protein